MKNALSLARAIDEEACLDTLAEMVRHKSHSETKGERILAERMVEIMLEMGLEAYLQPVEGDRVNAIGIWRGTGGGKSLLFNGHLDTNPVSEGWTVDPWGGLVDDRFIYGIGVSNMKAGDAASLCAVSHDMDTAKAIAGWFRGHPRDSGGTPQRTKAARANTGDSDSGPEETAAQRA